MDVSYKEYEHFIKWASDFYPNRIIRDVSMVPDPPIESFYDKEEEGVKGIIAQASILWGERDGIDPRPEYERKTPWWRDHCHIRVDWISKWEEASERDIDG